MLIDVNNGQQLRVRFDSHRYGMLMETIASDGHVTRADFIPDHEIVMLYDYWVNCKDGTEKSDYIKED